MSEDIEKRLAEAMGRDYKFHDGTTPPNVHSYFKPLTDANDDYAVLEWILKTRLKTAFQWDQFRDALYELNNGSELGYKIGNYARAALKVIEP